MRIGGLLVMCHGSRFFIFIIVYFFLELAFFSLFVRWDTKVWHSIGTIMLFVFSFFS